MSTKWMPNSVRACERFIAFSSAMRKGTFRELRATRSRSSRSLEGTAHHKNIGSLVDKVEAGSVVPTGSFYWITTTQQEFDEGSYTTTQSSADGSVQLISAQSSGAYISKVFDAGKTAKWDNISWGEPLPYKEHLEPDGTNYRWKNKNRL